MELKPLVSFFFSYVLGKALKRVFDVLAFSFCSSSFSSVLLLRPVPRPPPSRPLLVLLLVLFLVLILVLLLVVYRALLLLVLLLLAFLVPDSCINYKNVKLSNTLPFDFCCALAPPGGKQNRLNVAH